MEKNFPLSGRRTIKVWLAGITALVCLLTYPSYRFYADQQPGLPLEDIRLFSGIYAKVKNNYVDEVEDTKLMKGAIAGMLQRLDPYSTYLEKASYDDLKIGASGRFGGLGIEIGMKDGLVEVISPIDDTPAQRAGLKTGDLIFKIDDANVKELTLGEAVDLMRGEPKTSVMLEVLRSGEEKPLEFNIIRDIIRVNSVKFTLVEPDYGYVRISRFQEGTAEALAGAIKDMNEENGRLLGGLILDLRSNPGGILISAVRVADVFLPRGELVVYTRGRGEDSTAEYRTSMPDTTEGIALVVMIDGGSASASEIVAGVLQDTKRALIVGKTSFGKGSVQTLHPLNNGDALKLTTARYYTPRGRMIHDIGIEPDKVLDIVELTDEQIQERSQLPRSDLKTILSYDTQLSEALSELKSMEQSPNGEDIE